MDTSRKCKCCCSNLHRYETPTIFKFFCGAFQVYITTDYVKKFSCNTHVRLKEPTTLLLKAKKKNKQKKTLTVGLGFKSQILHLGYQIITIYILMT